VGSLPRTPKLSHAEIIERYQGGESVGLLSLRCRVPDYHITAVLAAAGVRSRGVGEALRLARSQRQRKPWSRGSFLEPWQRRVQQCARQPASLPEVLDGVVDDLGDARPKVPKGAYGVVQESAAGTGREREMRESPPFCAARHEINREISGSGRSGQ
jgi:hypothetical protein